MYRAHSREYYMQSQTNKPRLPDYVAVHKLSNDSQNKLMMDIEVNIVGNDLAGHAGGMLIDCYFMEKP